LIQYNPRLINNYRTAIVGLLFRFYFSSFFYFMSTFPVPLKRVLCFYNSKTTRHIKLQITKSTSK